MAEINIGLSSNNKKKTKDPFLDKQQIHKATNDAARKMIAFHEIWSVTANNGDNSFNLRRAVGTKKGVYAIDPNAHSFIMVGDAVLVIYENMDPSRPKISRVVGKYINGQIVPQTLDLTSWVQSEGNPYCNRGSVNVFSNPLFNGTFASIDTLPRFFYSSALQNDTPAFGDILYLEGVVIVDSAPSTSLPRVAAMVSLCDAAETDIVGYLLREYELQSGSWVQVSEWIHESATTTLASTTNNNQRNAGYLFYNKTADTYTIAGHDGLILCTRTNEPTPSVCTWANTYGDLPGNSSVSVASNYAIAGAYQGFEQGVSAGRSDCSVDVYVQGATAWTHIRQVCIADLLSDCEIVKECGIWNPQQDIGELDTGYSQENTRWAYRSGEWLVFVSGKTVVDLVVTKARCMLVGVNCSSGATRTIYTYNAPLEKLNSYSALIATLQEQMAYQSEPHPENWEPTGNPAPNDYSDTGHALGWSSGDLGSFGTVPPEDIEPTTGGPLDSDFRGMSQKIKNNAQWNPVNEPTIAPDSQDVEIAKDVMLGKAMPRGLVDKSNSDFFLCVNEWAWQANDELSYGNDDGLYEYNGLYYDFAGSTIPGDPHPYRVWVYEKTGTVNCSRNFPPESVFRRVKVQKYTANTLAASCDLTRTFNETVSGRDYTYYRSPDVFEYCEAGDYLWVYMSDWATKDDRVVSISLINKETMVEVVNSSIQPESRTLVPEAKRPQMICGVDSAGDPWAIVAAWYDATNSMVVDKLIYTGGFIGRSNLFDSAVDGELPELITEFKNLALSNGRQFWIDGNRYLVCRQE